MRHWTLALFVLAALLHIAPLWSVRYLPTGDGPTHVYNAWVLHELLSGDAPPSIERAYRIDWSPHPNWTGHAVMALLMFAVPPIAAEKLLLTLALALLFIGAWRICTAVDPESDVHAFFIFPLAWPQSLIAGYYNYSLSIGLFLLVLSSWWRRRERPSAKTIAILAAQLVLLYFTHPMATVLACLAIGLLSLVAGRFGHLLALIPVAPLLAFFGRAPASNVDAPVMTAIDWEAARILGTAEIVQSLSSDQRPIGIAVTILFAILCALTVMRDRDRSANALAFVVLAFAAAMFWLPAAEGTRALFSQRTAQFLYPVLAAWLTPRISPRARVAVPLLLLLIAFANLAIVWQHIRALGVDNARFVRMFDTIEPGTALLPLLFEREESGTIVPVFIHRVSYVALEKRLIDYGNYEPGSRYFPIAWREPVDASAIELAPRSISVAEYAPRAEYVLTHALPRGSVQRSDLQQRYSLIREHENLRLYRRKAPLQGEWDLVLLPFLGTRTDRGALHGARWRIEQRITNRATSDVRVVFRNCLDDMPCELVLRPNAMVPIATDERRFMFLHVPRGAAERLDVETVVRRADVDRPDLSLRLPPVPERAFVRGTLRIENVRARGRKVALRLYLVTGKPWDTVAIRVRSRESGAIAGERRLDMEGYGLFENTDLRTDFGNYDEGAEFVDVEIDSPPDGKVWAFVTSTDDEGRPELHLPVWSAAVPAAEQGASRSPAAKTPRAQPARTPALH
jgi:hypothetical protein